MSREAPRPGPHRRWPLGCPWGTSWPPESWSICPTRWSGIDGMNTGRDAFGGRPVAGGFVRVRPDAFDSVGLCGRPRPVSASFAVLSRSMWLLHVVHAGIVIVRNFSRARCARKHNVLIFSYTCCCRCYCRCRCRCRCRDRCWCRCCCHRRCRCCCHRRCRYRCRCCCCRQRCEAAGVAGQAACKSRATHGDPAEGATACHLHKTDDMVSQIRCSVLPCAPSGMPHLIGVQPCLSFSLLPISLLSCCRRRGHSLRPRPPLPTSHFILFYRHPRRHCP